MSLGIGSSSSKTTAVHWPVITPLSLTFLFFRGHSSLGLSRLATGVRSFVGFPSLHALIWDPYSQLLQSVPSLRGEYNSEISTPVILTATTGASSPWPHQQNRPRAVRHLWCCDDRTAPSSTDTPPLATARAQRPSNCSQYHSSSLEWHIAAALGHGHTLSLKV